MYHFHLFDAFGIEMEFMIVNRNSLAVMPISDKLLYDFSKDYSGDFENGIIDWSNELVAHVIELKIHQPASKIGTLISDFQQNIRQINHYLEKYDAMLLPTAMHPSFNPLKETVLWSHDNHEIYELYNQLFNCKDHGWSNLQSTHINLPFSNNEEFGKLHAAIRMILPIIPGIASSSPIVEGRKSDFLDSRMKYYLQNQKNIPSLVGQLIPEAVYSEKEYFNSISKPIIDDFSTLDPTHIMDHHFLNSRGAIARFDRKTIEIRVTDLQECVKADMVVAHLIMSMTKKWCFSPDTDFVSMKKIKTEELLEIFMNTIRLGGETLIENANYLSFFNIQSERISVNELWKSIANQIEFENKELSLETQKLLSLGTLSRRILNHLDQGKTIDIIYRKLADCLQNNTWFE